MATEGTGRTRSRFHPGEKEGRSINFAVTGKFVRKKEMEEKGADIIKWDRTTIEKKYTPACLARRKGEFRQSAGETSSGEKSISPERQHKQLDYA